MELFYERPAEYWDQALPIGNGALGAMIFGGVERERVQLNHEGLWSGGPQDRINPDCLGNLEKIRALYLDGRVDEAQRLAVAAMSGTPYTQRMYQTLGDLWIDFLSGDPGTPFTSYKRGLDLDTAQAWVRYERGGSVYERRCFASHPAGCIVIHMTASGGGKLSFTCRLDRKRHMDFSSRFGDDTIICGGGQHGIAWAMGLGVLSCDGGYQALGSRLTVSGASGVTLIFTALARVNGDAVELSGEVTDKLAAIRARRAGFDALLDEHIRDYRELYGGVSLALGNGGDQLDALPTDERLRRFAGGQADPGLAALYFQYGRYLMISGSRPGGLPLTLQGIWNEEFMPAWDSKYTININLEMNYWPADVCGLSQCAEPYFDLLQRVCQSGQATARRMYGCRGFVAHHNTDIHADTAPQDEVPSASYWVMGGAWLATAIWEHWLFTRDREFLSANFEVLEQAVLFFRDFLQENERGELVTLPSVSPENSYYLDGKRSWMCRMPAMDIEILTDLLNAYISAARELGRGELISEAGDMLRRLPPLRIASDGRLMEWEEEYGEPEPGHRHISHLYALFPGSQITPDGTPELAGAARRSLEYRLSHGGGYTGWSRAWIILFWARLGDGDRAFENIRALLADSTFENLMDNHPSKGRERGFVFQIDGNMGATAGVAELLLQSHNGVIRVLPALPSAWPEGRIRGLRVRGNAEAEISWRGGALEEFRLLAHSPIRIPVVYGGERRLAELEAGETFIWKTGGSLNVY